MDCKEFLDLMFEFIDDTLDDEKKIEMENQLKECSCCSELYENELEFTEEPLGGLMEQASSMELKEETIQEITKSFREKIESD